MVHQTSGVAPLALALALASLAPSLLRHTTASVRPPTATKLLWTEHVALPVSTYLPRSASSSPSAVGLGVPSQRGSKRRPLDHRSSCLSTTTTTRCGPLRLVIQQQPPSGHRISERRAARLPSRPSLPARPLRIVVSHHPCAAFGTRIWLVCPPTARQGDVGGPFGTARRNLRPDIRPWPRPAYRSSSADSQPS
ncbi:uncharacterized protein PSFLO_05427 [Pseudozyma flocculosa]|uniref:Secreted protein n=1 Tax=Pseudozyma flocculosa TaxID=84751 RepID=A0A5C3F8G9_9BASI|nr:uncharacterized protein PSFLO_05427 [Pseudozyma flocculosa]